MTHEAFLLAVRDVAMQDLPLSDRARRARILYGVGRSGWRGRTYFNAWYGPANTRLNPVDVVEISALCETGIVQLAGTLLHELGHVVAGGHGRHNRKWREACQTLGLTVTKARGQQYEMIHFAPRLHSLLESGCGDGVPNVMSRRQYLSKARKAIRPISDWTKWECRKHRPEYGPCSCPPIFRFKPKEV